VRGTATELHGAPFPDPVESQIRVVEVTGPALVLGSTQRPVEVPGVEVVRRRSGGGAVWVAPGDPLWVDVDLARDDPRWEDDVGRSFLWLGQAWADALAELGVAAEVHEGAFEPGRWGRQVCFAGRGPGEVFVGGRKVVGIAQRRTRSGARFQCAALRSWDPDPLLGAVVPPDADLAGVATGLGLDVDRVLASVVHLLGG